MESDGTQEAGRVGTELNEVRWHLDRLVEARLQGALSRAAERRFWRLIEQEEALLRQVAAS